MKKRIHPVAGILAMTLVASFIVATVLVEALGDQSTIVAVKTAILFALAILIPSVMIATGTGRSIAAGRKSPLLRRKRQRATLVACIGLLVLLPCAIVLRNLALAGNFGVAFVSIQAVELAGGLSNLVLLALLARDGRILTAARRRRARNARKTSAGARTDSSIASQNPHRASAGLEDHQKSTKSTRA